MKVLRKRFLVVLTVVMGIATIIGAVVTYFVFPRELFLWYFGIPLFYYLVGLGFGEVLRRINRESNERLLNIYLMVKIAKIIITIFFMALSMMLVDNRYDKEFVVIIGIFYMVYLILESKFYFDFEKSLKRKKTNEKLKV